MQTPQTDHVLGTLPPRLTKREIRTAVRMLGGARATAVVAQVSHQAVYRWLHGDCLPRRLAESRLRDALRARGIG